MQKLDQFDSLLSQGYFVKKKMAESKEKGLIEGEKKGIEEGFIKGHIEALHKHILRVVKMRFPQLEALAQQKTEPLADFKVLDELFDEIVVAQDEQAVRTLLENIKI